MDALPCDVQCKVWKTYYTLHVVPSVPTQARHLLHRPVEYHYPGLYNCFKYQLSMGRLGLKLIDSNGKLCPPTKEAYEIPWEDREGLGSACRQVCC